MKIIADPESSGLFTSCLAMDWKLPKTCQVKDCEEKTFAILAFTAEETPNGKSATVTICKKHYEEGKRIGKVNWVFEF